MKKIKFKFVLPYVAVVITVFLGVVSSFVYNGIFSFDRGEETSYNDISLWRRKTVLVAVKNPDNESLVTQALVSFNPKDKTIKTILIPSDTCVQVASSRQMVKNVFSIGGSEMMRESVQKLIPLTIDYHLVINSTDLYCPDGNYNNLINSNFAFGLWQQSDLKTYISEILSVANTDLTMFNIDSYVDFISRFANHTNEYYTLPGERDIVDSRSMYVADAFTLADFVTNSIIY